MVSKSKKKLEMMMVVKRSLIADGECMKKKQKNFKDKQKKQDLTCITHI